MQLLPVVVRLHQQLFVRRERQQVNNMATVESLRQLWRSLRRMVVHPGLDSAIRTRGRGKPVNRATEIERTIMEPIIVVPIQTCIPSCAYQATRGEPDEGCRRATGPTAEAAAEELVGMEEAAEDAPTEVPTPLTDAFARAKYDNSCAAASMGNAPGVSGYEESPEDAYIDALEFAQKLERQLTESKATISSLNAYADRLDRQRTQLVTAPEASAWALRSYQYGNSAITNGRAIPLK